MPANAFRTIGIVSSAGSANNEDRAGHAGDLAWVIDGATDVLEEPLLPGTSDAGWFAGRLDAALQLWAGQSTVPLQQLLAGVTAEIAADFARLARRPPHGVHEYPSAAGVIVRRHGDRADVLSLGDCELISVTAGAAPRVFGIDERLRTRDRGTALAMWAVREEGVKTWKDARKLLWPRFREARANLNQPGGYPVFSVIEPPADMVRVTTIALPPGSSLLLASDGFMRLVEIFERYSRSELMTAVLQRGVADLHAELRQLERDDGECLKYPRTKPSDDATALLLIAS